MKNAYMHGMTSVIIPTYNAETRIQALCEAVRSQAASAEILVVDSSSSDRTVEIAAACGARVMVVQKQAFDHGGTRTMAGKAAAGDILIYMTQDVTLSGNQSIENIIRPFEDQGVGASYGRQLPYPEANEFGALLRLFNYPEVSYTASLEDRKTCGIRTAFLSNSFAAYRKKALEEIGWFREKLIIGEDTYAGARMLLAGYKIAYVADALVYHSHNYSAMQEFRRYFDIGVFHASEHWIIEEFGKAEGEGKKYMQAAYAFLKSRRKYSLLPEFLVRSILKYIAYQLGQHYDKLPPSFIRRVSMHPHFWDR